MWQVRASTRGARRQRTLVGAIILSSVVALIAVILSQLFFRFRANYNVELDMTRTAESVAADQANLQASVEAVDAIMTLQTTTLPEATATDNQLSAVAEASSPTATVLLATNTPVIPTSTPIVLPTQTLTPVVPTAVILPSYTFTFTPTQKPPTAIATLTATPSPTQIPPTATSTLTVTPTRVLSPVPTNTRVVNGTAVLPQSVYVGLTVEDTPLGLKVTNVGDAAQSAGVEVGDYVLAVDLDIVTTRTQFLQTMQSRNPFSRITLRVRRADGINIITLVLGTNDFILATPAQ
ncbi:MAG: hypothetical protein H0X30_06890, partial [Anaerolineae bacterium]|nr:hypothetical protein [Anaerolineae bacterium]